MSSHYQTLSKNTHINVIYFRYIWTKFEKNSKYIDVTIKTYIGLQIKKTTGPNDMITLRKMKKIAAFDICSTKL